MHLAVFGAFCALVAASWDTFDGRTDECRRQGAGGREALPGVACSEQARLCTHLPTKGNLRDAVFRGRQAPGLPGSYRFHRDYCVDTKYKKPTENGFTLSVAKGIREAITFESVFRIPF